ncbi:uncharacterized protein [Rutidosis leptorrhynchoides]|uniref:uncharacterized protein n=1 Tax=Rutidosis leptorrhynchoides TaxID=125765 RepID=UPI003A99A5B5
MGLSFTNSFVQQIGAESSAKFWDEVWIGGNKLRLLFPRLFRLDKVKTSAIKDRITFAEGSLIWTWDWERNPAGRTLPELRDMCSLIEGYNFGVGNNTSIRWSISSDGSFTVKKLCASIEDHVYSGISQNNETLRNNLIPKKLEIFVWRAIQRRIPTRIELDKRGIDLHSVRCPLCDEDLESVEHTLIFCKHAFDLWDRVFSWWGFGSMTNLSINEILRGNCSTSTTTLGKKIWQAVEWVTSYLIWKNRNNKVFRDTNWNTPVALNEI